MKTMRGKNLKPAAGQPVFHKVAENLYRLESSGGYYAFVKKGDKQFRRSLKTKDRKLADRRLKEPKEQISGLSSEKPGRRDGTMRTSKTPVVLEDVLEAIRKVLPKVHGKSPTRANLYRLCIEEGCSKEIIQICARVGCLLHHTPVRDELPQRHAPNHRIVKGAKQH